jgi:hypothetical protein
MPLITHNKVKKEFIRSRLCLIILLWLHRTWGQLERSIEGRNAFEGAGIYYGETITLSQRCSLVLRA